MSVVDGVAVADPPSNPLDPPAGLQDARADFTRETQPNVVALESLLESMIREAASAYSEVRAELKKRPKRSERGLILEGTLAISAMRSAQLCRAAMGAAGGANQRANSYEQWVMAALAEGDGGSQT